MAGCNQSPPQETGSLSAEALIKRGQAVYSSNCTACHNSNPTQAGALAPAVAGSSLELLEARILYSKYPEGYTPKGAPGGAKILMPALPHLKSDIPALHSYLNSVPATK